MKISHLVISLVAAVATIGLLISGCTQAAPAPPPTAAPAAPAKAIEPTKAPAEPAKAAEPTKAVAAQPTAAPVAKLDYPAKNKSIRFISPWAVGGSSDIGSRLLAGGLQKELGIPVEVFAMPGATGQVGAEEAAKSKPDGYTIVMTSQPTLISTYLDPGRKAAYNRKSFEPVANAASQPGTILVKADGPYKTMKDLVDAGKADPGKLSVADSGLRGSNHLSVVLLQKLTGAKFKSVHFDGAAEVTAALMGGHVNAASLAVGNYAPLFKNGDVRVLGIMAKERVGLMPGVPTMVEQGLDLLFTNTIAVAAPGGTPREIVNMLSAAIKKTVEDSEVRKKFDDLSFVADYMDATQFAAYWDKTETTTKELLSTIVD